MKAPIRLKDAVLKPTKSQPDARNAVRYQAPLHRGRKPITVLKISGYMDEPRWIVRHGEMTYAKATAIESVSSSRPLSPSNLEINFIEGGRKETLDLWLWGDGFFQVFEGHCQLRLVDLPERLKRHRNGESSYAVRMEEIDCEERNSLEWAQAFAKQASLNGEPLWGYSAHTSQQKRAEEFSKLRERLDLPDYWFDRQAGHYVFSDMNRDRADHDPMTRFSRKWPWKVEHDPVKYALRRVAVALDHRAWERYPADNPLGNPDFYYPLVTGHPWRTVTEIVKPFAPELHQRIVDTVGNLDATCERVQVTGMLGPWTGYEPGSDDFYLAIANGIQIDFDSWRVNYVRRLGEEIKPILDAAPWLSWPQEKPIGCPYEWSRLITGREDGWERVLAVLKYAAPVGHEQAVALLEGREPQPVDTLSLQEMADQRTRLRWAREKEEQHQRTVERANATRKRRRAMKLDAVVRQLQQHGALPTNLKKCAICSKALTDPESIKRGIGPECWQGVLSQIEASVVSEVQP